MGVPVTPPMAFAGEASHLSGWAFEWKSSEPQPADGAISLVVPANSGPKEFTLRLAGDPGDCMMLFGSGVIGLAGLLRRKLGR
jgi:hypothetical protein